MKKLLLLILFVLPVVTQAQTASKEMVIKRLYPVKIGDRKYYVGTPEAALWFKIDSLSKRVSELEKKMDILYNLSFPDTAILESIIGSYKDMPWLDQDTVYFDKTIIYLKRQKK